MQLQFHIYGFILGLAIIFASWLIENQLKKDLLLNKIYYKVGLISLFFAVIGARVWHVVTDFYFYQDNLNAIFEVWNGGLSFFGGVLGSVTGLVIAFFVVEDIKILSWDSKKKNILKLLDFSIFGLPAGHAIGRLANYFNQELYGRPTNSFIKIYIDEAHRLPGYDGISYYQPLFLFEALFTGFFAISLYVVKHFKRIKLPKIGSGSLFLLYVLYYSIIRFFLDFLRIDKPLVIASLGANQVILIGVILITGTYFYKKRWHKK